MFLIKNTCNLLNSYVKKFHTQPEGLFNDFDMLYIPIIIMPNNYTQNRVWKYSRLPVGVLDLFAIHNFHANN